MGQAHDKSSELEAFKDLKMGFEKLQLAHVCKSCNAHDYDIDNLATLIESNITAKGMKKKEKRMKKKEKGKKNCITCEELAKFNEALTELYQCFRNFYSCWKLRPSLENELFQTIAVASKAKASSCADSKVSTKASAEEPEVMDLKQELSKLRGVLDGLKRGKRDWLESMKKSKQETEEAKAQCAKERETKKNLRKQLASLKDAEAKEILKNKMIKTSRDKSELTEEMERLRSKNSELAAELEYALAEKRRAFKKWSRLEVAMQNQERLTNPPAVPTRAFEPCLTRDLKPSKKSIQPQKMVSYDPEADLADIIARIRASVPNVSYNDCLDKLILLKNCQPNKSLEAFTTMRIVNEVRSHLLQRRLQSQAEECCICLLSLRQGPLMSLNGCGHSFHKDCIKQWMTKKSDCPMCRKSSPFL